VSVDAAGQLQTSLAERLAAARAADPVDAETVAELEGQLARATELIDLLESAVATAVAAASQPTS
jgi:hypothetical protein